MDLLHRVDLRPGFNEIISPDEGILKYIGFSLLILKNGDAHHHIYDDKETGLIILRGKCSIKVGREVYQSIGKRDSVFAGRAYAAYIPPNTEFEVVSESDCEIAVSTAPASKKSQPRLITPKENKIREVGRDNWKRGVYDIIDTDVDAERLLIGETINPPGNWSSYPPHKHDVDNLPQESKHEELYFFKIEPEQGFGLQRLYTADGSLDVTYMLKNNDVVLIPKGYHPVVAAAGYQLYYLWILAGEKRILAMNDDPNHQWIKNT